MRVLIPVVLVFLMTPFAVGQAGSDQSKEAQVKEELHKLYLEAKEAVLQGDRTALERVYADEFLFIHSTGGVDNKAEWITKTLSIDPNFLSIRPGLQLNVYGDVAVLRGPLMGLWGTGVYAKRGGRWQVVQIQSTRLLPERKAVKIDPKILDSYVGKYEETAGVYTVITRDGDTLMAQGAGRPKVRWAPLSDTQFLLTSAEAEMTFYKDERGQVTHFIIRRGSGQEVKGKKVE